MVAFNPFILYLPSSYNEVYACQIEQELEVVSHYYAILYVLAKFSY